MSDNAIDPPARKSAGAATEPRRRKPRRALLFGGGGFLLLGLGAGGAYAFVPGIADAVKGMLGQDGTPAHGTPAHATAAIPAAPAVNTFIELPEIALTLPNGGRPRQLRIALAIEVGGDPALVRPALTSPRVLDSLVLYLRTLRDTELEGALAIDRLRGDIYRRIDLLVGPNIVRDVLITSFLVA